MLKIYDKSVRLTLRFYEGWILPSGGQHDYFRSLKSLQQVKIDEFNEKKKLLNPYSKQKMLEEESQPEEELDRLKFLAKNTSMSDMKTFKMTYNRHLGRYGHRQSNFPKEYLPHESSMNYGRD